MAKTMRVQLLNVSKTTAEWANSETIIPKGLICVEFTTDGATYVKIGNGTDTFADLGYLEDGAIDLTQYYTKTETDDAIVEAIQSMGKLVTIKGTKSTVAELPKSTDDPAPEVGDVWFVGAAGDGNDSFAEYVYTIEGTWEFFGKSTNNVAEMVGATSETAGTAGIVPAPKAGEEGKFLRGDGTWAEPDDTTYELATEEADGLMSKEDKETMGKVVTTDDTLILMCDLDLE